MQDSKRGFLQMSHGIKLSKSQCPTMKDERERMDEFPYALGIGLSCMPCFAPDSMSPMP